MFQCVTFYVNNQVMMLIFSRIGVSLPCFIRLTFHMKIHTCMNIIVQDAVWRIFMKISWNERLNMTGSFNSPTPTLFQQYNSCSSAVNDSSTSDAQASFNRWLWSTTVGSTPILSNTICLKLVFHFPYKTYPNS